MVDFHSHSTASDGMLTPAALATLARSQGVTALALTDHDTVAGLDEAHQACRVLGIRFFGGIELEIAFDEGEFHLLGLGLQQWTDGWVVGLKHLQQLRARRNLTMFRRMQEAGIQGEFEQIEALAQGGQVGRPHFARFLVEKGKVETIQDAFNHFLGRGRLFYEPKAGLELGEAISMIHEAGGLAVVAHPKTLRLSVANLAVRLPEWKLLGLDGLEAWHPGVEPRVARRLEALARSFGLKVSGGSDFHGETRPDRQLGRSSGGLPLGEAILEGLFPVPGETSA